LFALLEPPDSVPATGRADRSAPWTLGLGGWTARRSEL